MTDYRQQVYEHVLYFGCCPHCDYTTQDVDDERNALDILMEHVNEEHPEEIESANYE